MGGPRAVQLARRLDASQLELVDPVSIRPIQSPDGTATVVYRASQPGRIQSTQVIGQSQEYWVPTDHPGMAVQYPSFVRQW